MANKTMSDNQEKLIEDLLKGVGIPAEISTEAAKILQAEIENPNRKRTKQEQEIISQAWKYTDKELLLDLKQELENSSSSTVNQY